MKLLDQAVFMGFAMGIIARLITLKSDYRRYPSYPQGYAIHLILGAVASGIGALFIPSLIEGEYTAVSFFALAVQQFREVKNAERDALLNLESQQVVKRGNAYIEDIARKFEVRNYLALITACLVSISVLVFKHSGIGLVVGVLIFVVIMVFIREKYVKDIGVITEEKLYFDDYYMKTGNVVFTNIPIKEIKDAWLKEGVVIRITPKDNNGRLALYDFGQQQAILHDVYAQLGHKNDLGEPWLNPFAKLDNENHSIVVAMITFHNSVNSIIKAAKFCPIIESARKETQKQRKKARRKE